MQMAVLAGRSRGFWRVHKPLSWYKNKFIELLLQYDYAITNFTLPVRDIQGPNYAGSNESINFFWQHIETLGKQLFKTSLFWSIWLLFYYL